MKSNTFLFCSDDRFRANFLHGRRPMLKELARQLASQEGPLVWVDLGKSHLG